MKVEIISGKTINRTPKNIIRKLKYDTKSIKNPNQAFDSFEREVTRHIQRNEIIDTGSFYAKLNSIGENFVKENNVKKMTHGGKRLAERLVHLDNGNLAGIIYGVLIKMNKNNPDIVEPLAQNGLAIAKRFHDPVHIMARYEDLRRIYSVSSPKSEKLIKILYDEKRALSDICKNYNSAATRYHTINREMKPLENYKIMLCEVKVQLAKLLIVQNKPNDAKQELLSANEILSDVGKGRCYKEVQKLLRNFNM